VHKHLLQARDAGRVRLEGTSDSPKDAVKKAVLARQLGAGGADVEMARHCPLGLRTEQGRDIAIEVTLKSAAR